LKPALPLLHLAFVLAGAVTTLLGPLVPALSARWSLSDAHMGTVFTAQFASSVAGGALSTEIAARLGVARSLAGGFALMAIGVGTLVGGGWFAGLSAAAGYGFGLGLVLAPINLLVARGAPGREAAALSVLNVAWAAGAMAWPIVVTLGGPANVAAVTQGLAAALAIMMLALAVTMSSATLDAIPSNAGPLPSIGTHRRLVLLFGGLMLLYGGTEHALGGWLAEYARRVGPQAETAAWALVPTFFWGALMAGRVLAPAALRHTTESGLLVASLGLALLAISLLLTAATRSGVAAGAALAGLALAPVFPITLAAMARDIGVRTPRLVGPLFSLTGIGAATMPWLVGITSSGTGSLRLGLLVCLGGCIGLAALHGARLRRTSS
jgi:MFS transporter, FHS family, glucose/mannose:H+ symporter